MSAERCWGVLLAAGSGSRLAATRPKQFLQLAGATVLEHSLRALLACEVIVKVVVVLPPEEDAAEAIGGLASPRVLQASGGAQRCDSVVAGLTKLQELADDRDWVLVHDAARPCVALDDIQQLIVRVTASGVGALLAEPVVDTLKAADAGGRVQATVERAGLWRAQTPQMFRLGELRDALLTLRAQNRTVTDEAAAMEWSGRPVDVVAAASPNPKLTLPGDVELAAYYLARATD